MGTDVYANGNAIACKAGDGKVVAAFPDVCLSPPSPPAGPIPIPYPNSSFSKDMKNGSKSVAIKGKEIMLRDQSFYKTSPLGNEAATRTFGAGVISHVIAGKTYFVAWSMDVKFEGLNVDRHIDLTTSNHASPIANEAAPMPALDTMAPGAPADCEQVLVRYPVESYKDQKKKKGGVYKGKQSHHVIQNSHFQKPRGTTIKEICPGYTEDEAPCIPLLNGTNPKTEHGRASKMQKADAKRYRNRGTNPTYEEARGDAKKQLAAKPKPGLSDDEAECILVKVDKYFEKACGGTAGKQLRPPGQKGAWKPTALSGGGAGGAL